MALGLCAVTDSSSAFEISKLIFLYLRVAGVATSVLRRIVSVSQAFGKAKI